METEKRLIDANSLLEFAMNLYNKTIIPSDIESFPTVDAVEVVHGEWLNTKFTTELLCGNCFELTYIPITKSGRKPYNYCPNCGAKMDGDGNG